MSASDEVFELLRWTRENLDARIARITEYGYDQEMLKLIEIIDELWDEIVELRRPLT